MKKGEKLSEKQKAAMAEGRRRAMEAKKEEPVIQAESPFKAPERRRKRGKLGEIRQKLGVDQSHLDSNYKYRWVNDDYNRIDQLHLSDDYDFVTDKRIKSHQEEGKIKRLVGENKDGSPKFAYLMRIPKDFYEENRKEIEDTNMEIERSIQRGDVKADDQDKTHFHNENIQYETH